MIHRIQASIQRRGLFGTIGLGIKKTPLVIHSWRDRLFDNKFGTETHNKTELADLQIESQNKTHGIRYEPTQASAFSKLLSKIRPNVEGTFVDLGCGKGRVLILAAEHGFTRLVGVDFSPELADIARSNLAVYARHTKRSPRFEIKDVDAVEFAIEKNQTIFFCFNPFNHIVMERVLHNIDVSCREHPRMIWLIYLNPVWRATIEQTSFFTSHRDYKINGCHFVVYQHT